jgi:hypothetical protein
LHRTMIDVLPIWTLIRSAANIIWMTMVLQWRLTQFSRRKRRNCVENKPQKNAEADQIDRRETIVGRGLLVKRSNTT